MDYIVVKEYVLVYFYILISEYNYLDFDFLKKFYDVVDVKLVIFIDYEGGEIVFFFLILSNSKYCYVFFERIFYVIKIFIMYKYFNNRRFFLIVVYFVFE